MSGDRKDDSQEQDVGEGQAQVPSVSVSSTLTQPTGSAESSSRVKYMIRSRKTNTILTGEIVDGKLMGVFPDLEDPEIRIEKDGKWVLMSLKHPEIIRNPELACLFWRLTLSDPVNQMGVVDKLRLSTYYTPRNQDILEEMVVEMIVEATEQTAKYLEPILINWSVKYEKIARNENWKQKNTPNRTKKPKFANNSKVAKQFSIIFEDIAGLCGWLSRKMPVIGVVVDYGLNLISGDNKELAAWKTIGSLIGASVGMAVMGFVLSATPVGWCAIAVVVLSGTIGGLFGECFYWDRQVNEHRKANDQR